MFLLLRAQWWNRSQSVSRREVLEHLPTLRPDGLRGGVRYFDAQFDDARLAICLAQTLEDLGGKTKMTSRDRFPSVESLEGALSTGMVGGAIQTWDRLASELAKAS